MNRIATETHRKKSEIIPRIPRIRDDIYHFSLLTFHELPWIPWPSRNDK